MIFAGVILDVLWCDILWCSTIVSVDVSCVFFCDIMALSDVMLLLWYLLLCFFFPYGILDVTFYILDFILSMWDY